jgi:hypothetical protein
LDGFTNTHKCRIWATGNPVVIHEKPLHPERVTVWCAICSTDVTGPYFIEDEMGRALMVTGDRYWAMITTFLAPAVECMTMNQERSLWFQQDGATCHTARESMACLRQLLPRRLISIMETFFGHPGLQIWQLQIFFYGATWRKVYTKQSPAPYKN